MVSVKEITAFLRSEGIVFDYIGKEDLSISGFSSLMNYKEGTITWIKKQSTYDASVLISDPTLVVVQKGVKTDLPNVIVTDSSKAVFFGILEHFFDNEIAETSMGQGTYISPQVKLGEDVSIGHNCTIDGDIEIGDGTRIYNNVVILHNARIGSNCIIHSGAVIGTDGFGYYSREDETFGKVKHFGGVVIESDVEIGANACIDRGTIDDTLIQRNAKIDNLVHIAHNVRIGESSLIIAGSIICGSVEIENGGYIAPGSIIKNQLHIGEGSIIGMGAVVIDSVNPDTVVAGVPAREIHNPY